MKDKITGLTRSIYAIRILDFLFNRPIFTSTLLVAESQIPKASVARLFKQLEQGSIIKKVIPGKGQSPAIHMFPHLLRIVEI